MPLPLLLYTSCMPLGSRSLLFGEVMEQCVVLIIPYLLRIAESSAWRECLPYNEIIRFTSFSYFLLQLDGARLIDFCLSEKPEVLFSPLPSTKGQVHKVVEIAGLEIYCNSSNGASSLTIRDNARDNQCLGNANCESNQFHPILAPLNVSVLLSVWVVIILPSLLSLDTGVFSCWARHLCTNLVFLDANKCGIEWPKGPASC